MESPNPPLTGSMIPRRVFAFWLGDAPMSEDRKRACVSLANTGVDVVLLTDDDVNEWILPAYPLHAAWPYLSAVHRADYLRTYLMHHYGGGYSDVDFICDSWLPCFDELEREPRLLGVGTPELSPDWVARLDVRRFAYRSPRTYTSPASLRWWRYRWLRLNYRKLLGNGSYIFVRDTEFTAQWIAELHRRLDMLLPNLVANPAHHPKDRRGRDIDGFRSDYPVSWSQLLGDIFHPLTLRYHRRLSQNLPLPCGRA